MIISSTIVGIGVVGGLIYVVEGCLKLLFFLVNCILFMMKLTLFHVTNKEVRIKKKTVIKIEKTQTSRDQFFQEYVEKRFPRYKYATFNKKTHKLYINMHMSKPRIKEII